MNLQKISFPRRLRLKGNTDFHCGKPGYLLLYLNCDCDDHRISRHDLVIFRTWGSKPMSNILSASSRIIIVIRRRLVTCNQDLVIVEVVHIVVSESLIQLLIIFIKSLVKNHYWYSPRMSLLLLKQEREWVETDQPITSVIFVTDVKLIFYIFTFDDQRCGQITYALLITLMITDLAAARVMHIIV